jgi:hypothetical protein
MSHSSDSHSSFQNIIAPHLPLIRFFDTIIQVVSSTKVVQLEASQVYHAQIMLIAFLFYPMSTNGIVEPTVDPKK